jgi:DNA polymerase III alpha subunit
LKYAQFEPNPHEEINKIVQELPYFNIQLLPPDLAKSDIDFKIEEENIRYGLNSIKGVSTKVLESLLEFREQSFSNKYEVFLAAKQVSLNIGVLSALIQAGVLDSFVSKDRCRLVLEAQTFNILTDREKRNIVALGEKYNFDILKTIADCSKEQLMGDDNKRILSEKRFNTFKTKYQPYKEIYEKNHKHLKFANWFFETKLLGYSYSHNVREVFKSEIEGSLISSNEVSSLEENQTVRFVGTVSDIMTRTSANGNKYARMDIFDDLGKLTVLLMDSEREGRLTNYLNSGKVLPKKDSIVIISGKKNRDIVFAEKLSLLEEKIYMKLSEIK